MEEPSLQAGRSVAERRCEPVVQSSATLARHTRTPILDAPRVHLKPAKGDAFGDFWRRLG